MLNYINFPNWLKPEIIPGLPIRWYGLMYLFAFAVAFFLFKYQVKEKKLKILEDDIVNLFFWTILGLLIGARILATTLYDSTHYYITKPWLIFWPFREGFKFTGLQGMSYHGGVIGAFVAAIIYCRVKKQSFLQWGDMLVTGLPLGYTFGRLGNFINGELYGRVTAAPWGMVFPTVPRAEHFSSRIPWVKEIAEKINMDISEMVLVNLPRHPSQLYEAFFEGIVLWLILWFIFRNRKPFEGFMLGAYLAGYGFFRFFIEYVREPDFGIGFPIKLGQDHPIYLFESMFNFTTGQILCFLMILTGIGLNIFLFFYHKKKKFESADSDN